MVAHRQRREAMNGLLNRKAAKKFILDKAADIRIGWPCSRVSKEGLDVIEAKLRMMIISMVEGHPSVGKTFRP